MTTLPTEVPDLNDKFKKDKAFEQMVLELDLPEVQLDSMPPDQARLRAESARHALMAKTGDDVPVWINEYFMLRDKGWPFRQAAYIAWASMPSDKRMPKTQQELATMLGLSSDRAISTWRKKNHAILEAIALMQSAPLWEHRSDAFKNLIQGMNKSGADYKFFNHLKLFLEVTGDSELIVNLKKKLGGDASELSDEQIAAMKYSFEDDDSRAEIDEEK